MINVSRSRGILTHERAAPAKHLLSIHDMHTHRHIITDTSSSCVRVDASLMFVGPDTWIFYSYQARESVDVFFLCTLYIYGMLPRRNIVESVRIVILIKSIITICICWCMPCSVLSTDDAPAIENFYPSYACWAQGIAAPWCAAWDACASLIQIARSSLSLSYTDMAIARIFICVFVRTIIMAAASKGPHDLCLACERSHLCACSFCSLSCHHVVVVCFDTFRNRMRTQQPQIWRNRLECIRAPR